MVVHSRRRLSRAPKPPGAQLIEKSIQNRLEFTAKPSESAHDLIAVAELSPAQEYEFRRQSRKRMYYKQLEDFKKNDICGSSPVDVSTSLSRSPSRYLQALLKHEPDRRKAAMILYPDAFNPDKASSATANDEAFFEEHLPSLNPSDDLMVLLTRWACPMRARYAHQDAEPTQDNHCRVCKKVLQQ
jgi:hypothetical protein